MAAHLTEASVERAIDVQGEIVSRGAHRAPRQADLILVACAVTGQPMEWVAPAGSIP